MSESDARAYDPEAVQHSVWADWERVNAFHAVPEPGRQPYAVVIPPPNVTAALHMGHALNNTLQDVLVRWRRMAGDNAVWIPGTDHAGIATQTVVDKRLQQEGEPALKDYKKMEAEGQGGKGGGGREQFIAKVQAWKDEYERRITEQLKAMGCSCDWDRQRFTMDEVCAAAVREAFFKLFKAGLIYRGKRLVNWDPVSQTALADDEVEMREIDGHFWYMKYPIVDENAQPTGDFATVATTRPETMLGDTAVAVNPTDEQNKHLIGKSVRVPIVNRIIPIVGDDHVVIADPESDDPKAKFASGFLKVTPAHDPNDWEIGQRHGLDVINVMAPDGSISRDHGWPAHEWEGETVDPFAHDLLGKSREDARKAIIDWFREHDLLAEVRPYSHSVGHSYRSHVPIEPYLSDQWYVKVTDDRLRGAALRAMATDQRTATSRDREGADRSAATNTYLITFTTYGTWLHGDERGSVDRENNLPGEPHVPDHAQRREVERDAMESEPVTLNAPKRDAVEAAIREVCDHRGWKLLAINVRTNHVHVVVQSTAAPERVMNDFKSYGTRRLVERDLVEKGTRIWTRHGSTRYLNEPASIEAACAYVVEGQGEDLPRADDQSTTAPSRSRLVPGTEGASAKTSRDREGADRSRDWQGGLRFYPERYAKTFETWHENIRDWCISRQLWWGHRIPVWSGQLSERAFEDDESPHPHADRGRLERKLRGLLEQFANEEGVADDYALSVEDTDAWWICARSPKAGQLLERVNRCRIEFQPAESAEPQEWPEFRNPKVAHELASLFYKFHQDPDVLDTWFSSALWPISTLGWPDPSQFPDAFAGDPSPDAALQQWNPSSTLCTAREIITLWVSRMVMFNLFFRDCLPFRDVFIHAMIQDGEGQKMSKSLGNGVDPLDIIDSHGADAMRFTLAKMTTQTQDVRMPVDVVCPHTGETFQPKMIATPSGPRVAAPIQSCPSDPSKKMVTSYGLSSGQAKPTEQMPLARNTSTKFDEGRNFANKVWNAGRFVMGKLGAEASEAPKHEGTQGEASLADRWILSRLARTISQADQALGAYQFSGYAQGLYDFIWRDYCDWYLEAIKPVVDKNDPRGEAARATAAAVLDAILRLLHPVMPFLTEKMWQQLNAAQAERSLPGVTLPPAEQCMTAAWPSVEPNVVDASAEQAFELVREVVVAIRNVRNQYNVPPRQSMPVSVRTDRDSTQMLADAAELLEALAIVEVTEIGPHVEAAEDAATSLVGEIEVYVQGLVDPKAERERLGKRLEELSKSRGALTGRLNNPGYVQKAPEHLVQQTRDQLAEVEREIEAIEAKLASL